MDMRDLIAKLTAIEENKVQDTGKAIKIQTSSHDDDDINMHDEVEESREEDDEEEQIEESRDDDYDHDSLDKDDIDYIEKNSKEDHDEEDSDDKEVKESVELDECGEMTSMPQQSDNVSMTINMSGSGEGGIRDILNILNDIEHRSAQSQPQQELPVGDKELNKDATMIIGTKSIEDRARETEEELANTPRPKYSTLKQITASGDDLHKSKDMYARSQPGDNAMAVKQRLESLYNFVKTR